MGPKKLRVKYSTHTISSQYTVNPSPPGGLTTCATYTSLGSASLCSLCRSAVEGEGERDGELPRSELAIGSLGPPGTLPSPAALWEGRQPISDAPP